MKSPKVTVLMAVYNGEKYLREAIDSILNQTFEDFEFLIINDGSTDRTSEVLQSYRDSRIKIINNKKNVGLTKSLNKGLRMARGEYIARMDADDVSMPERLERQVKFSDKNKDVGLLGSPWYTINADGRKTGVSEAASCKQDAHFMCHGATLIRKNCLEEIGLYREIFEYAQDYDLWLRIANEFEVANLREPLYKLRIYGDSISSSRGLQQNLYASLAIEMAEERKKYGKDRLSLVDQKEAIKIRDQRLRVSGIKKRRVLSHNYSTWSQAAFALGNRRGSFNYAMDSISWYMLNYHAWSMLMKIIAKDIKDNPTKLITTTLKFLIHIGNNLRQRIIKAAVSRNILRSRKMYWNHRSSDIDEKGGTEKDDYALLSKIILSLKPRRILDIGCGSGRLFPLYKDLKIKEVVGQDVSSKALKIAKDRYRFSNIKTTNQHILNLNFPMHYFDLIISNRVLQHIPHDEIEVVIKKLTELGDYVYINEMSDSDYTGESFYLFKHDYIELFNKYDFKVIQKGLLEVLDAQCLVRQTWFLFGKNFKEGDGL